MQMGVVRCKTPELVRKEIWTHILAYNLIRTVIAQAAIKHGYDPRTISFKGAMQTLEAFQPMIAIQGHRSSDRLRFYHQLLDAIASHRVADRPDRLNLGCENGDPSTMPFSANQRHEIKLEMAKGLKA